MKRNLLLCAAMMCCAVVFGQTWMSADTYYKSANLEGKSGSGLVSALNSLINSHVNVGYDGLWDVYDDSDTDPDGYYYDIYAEGCKFTYSKKCGNYTKVCSCVNREHSLPKSWWGSNKDEKYSDAFHLYPSDGYVNNMRSAYALGECANGQTVAEKQGKDKDPNNQGRGKLGASTFSGYSGTVFEPIDTYKGDLARSYMYMVVCYNSSDFTSGAGDAMFEYSGNKADLSSYSVDLLMKWHRQDPVSQRERDRNNGIAKHQHNRNPFIDFPDLAEYIWGNKNGQVFNTTTAIEESYLTPEYRIEERHLTSGVTMHVFDLMGRHIASGEDIELHAAGIYLVRFNNNTSVKILVK